MGMVSPVLGMGVRVGTVPPGRDREVRGLIVNEVAYIVKEVA